MKAIVFIHDEKPDKDGRMVEIGGLRWLSDGVPVRLNFQGDPIGWAKLSREGLSLVADISMLSNFKGTFFPSIGYRVMEQVSDPRFNCETIIKAEVLVVSLGASNVDSRIPAVEFSEPIPAPTVSLNRVKSVHMMDMGRKEERDWRVSAEILVPGLGEVGIRSCLSQETIDKICEEVLFALNQKMGVKA